VVNPESTPAIEYLDCPSDDFNIQLLGAIALIFHWFYPSQAIPAGVTLDVVFSGAEPWAPEDDCVGDANCDSDTPAFDLDGGLVSDHEHDSDLEAVGHTLGSASPVFDEASSWDDSDSYVDMHSDSMDEIIMRRLELEIILALRQDLDSGSSQSSNDETSLSGSVGINNSNEDDTESLGPLGFASGTYCRFCAGDGSDGTDFDGFEADENADTDFYETDGTEWDDFFGLDAS
jgi:hypothetical protein